MKYEGEVTDVIIAMEGMLPIHGSFDKVCFACQRQDCLEVLFYTKFSKEVKYVFSCSKHKYIAANLGWTEE